MTIPWLTRFVAVEAALEQTEAPVAVEHGTMRTLLYAPRGEDSQQPHKRDEVYVVRTGTAEFVRDGERARIAAGDVFFVPASMQHRFENFSADFQTWVVFWGPEGGEH
ncbi:MAG: cupin domain-containing protein [Novosphingobium sp.]|nr:cupin domain-containing protein [Novosphingobium sp.]